MENYDNKTAKDGRKGKTKTTRNDPGYEQERKRNEGESSDPFAKAPRVIRTPPPKGPKPRTDSCPELKLPLGKTQRPTEDRDKRKRAEEDSLPSLTTEVTAERGNGTDDEVFVLEGSPSPEATRKPKKKRELGPWSSWIAGAQLGETEDESAMTNGLIQLMQKVENMTSEMKWLTKTNVNTKVEIKKLAKDMDLASQLLARKLHKYCKTVARKLRKSSGSDKQTSPSAASTEKVNVCTQTDPSLRNLRRREDEEKKVTEAQTDEDIIEAARIKWPEEWFEATKIRPGNPWNSLGEEDFAILLPESEANMESGIARLLKDRFPEVARIERTGSLTVTNTVQLEAEDPVIRHRKIHKVGLNGTTEAEFLTALKTLKSLVSQGSGGVVLPIPTGADVEGFRKLADLVFRRDGLRALIHVPYRTGDRTRIPLTQRPTVGETRRERRTFNTEVLLVKQGQRSYTEMVKGLKTMVGGNQDIKMPKQVRKTKDGRLLIAFKKGDTEAMEVMKRQLKDKWDGVEVSDGSRRDPAKCILHVKGLDDSVEDDEIKEAICGVVPALEKEAVEIGPRRPMYGGNWAVTVTVVGKDLDQLRRRSNIKIGFNTCIVEERLDITKCFRCWDFGHLAKNCKGPDRRMLCSRCGQEGHLAAACENVFYCVLCGKSGHRGGAGSCPKFQQALMEKRAALKEMAALPPHDG